MAGPPMKRRLLFVDDELSVRERACRQIDCSGHWHAVPVGSGAEALELCAGATPFDAVVLDTVMPGLNGPSTLEWLRADGLDPRTSVIFATPKLTASDREFLESFDVDGMIAKPLKSQGLSAQLLDILKSRPVGRERIAPNRSASWRRSMPAVDLKLMAIEAGLIEPDDRRKVMSAVAAAHWLAGLLGSFGLRHGTEFARRIETSLEQRGSDAAHSCAGPLADLRTVVASA
jgi:CheY-like chemotaxis protein